MYILTSCAHTLRSRPPFPPHPTHVVCGFSHPALTPLRQAASTSVRAQHPKMPLLLTPMLLDLASLKSVKEFADAFAETGECACALGAAWLDRQARSRYSRQAPERVFRLSGAQVMGTLHAVGLAFFASTYQARNGAKAGRRGARNPVYLNSCPDVERVM